MGQSLKIMYQIEIMIEKIIRYCNTILNFSTSAIIHKSQIHITVCFLELEHQSLMKLNIYLSTWTVWKVLLKYYVFFTNVSKNLCGKVISVWATMLSPQLIYPPFCKPTKNILGVKIYCT